jgi:hypothetical protein
MGDGVASRRGPEHHAVRPWRIDTPGNWHEEVVREDGPEIPALEDPRVFQSPREEGHDRSASAL